MSFQSLFAGTYELSLEPLAPGYRVVLKKFLTQNDLAQASEALLADNTFTSSDAEVRSRVDTGGYQLRLVMVALVSWNLDDDTNKVMAMTEANIKALPGPVFQMIYAAVKLGLDGPSEEDKTKDADFRPADQSIPEEADQSSP